MIPTSNNDLQNNLEVIKQPSKTYRLDINNGVVDGFLDDLSAIEQGIYKILNTERYDYLIYSWNYGSELSQLFGQPIPFVYSELERLISEALLQDNRIFKVENFEFSSIKNSVSVKFTAITTEGDLQVEKVVKI